MLKPVAVLACLLSVTPALAIECPLTHAIYEQSGGDWQLRFQPVPRDSAANQVASFSIAIAGDDIPFEGGVYIPNGFGQPLGDVLRDCPVPAEDEWLSNEEIEACRFWQGKVYALVDGTIVDFPYDADIAREDARAPDEVLLPGFASNVWYSMLREVAFKEHAESVDTFRLTACAR